jgi:membrane-associated phospholipid phosphatase
VNSFLSVRRTLGFSIALSVLLLCGRDGRAAAAEDESSAYRLSFELDVPLILVAGGVASSYLFIDEAPPPACAPLCDKSNVNRFDRWLAGHYSPTWNTVGNVATISTLVLVPAAVIAGEPSRAGLVDLLVVGETVLVSSAIQVTMGYAVTRPRPRLYSDEAPLDMRNDSNAGRSFFSGHAADCLAGTLAATTALRRTGHRTLSWVTLAVGLAGSAMVGASRVASGGHFLSDVLVGYAVGAGVGIAVPALHTSRIGVSPMAGAGVGGVGIAGRF